MRILMQLSSSSSAEGRTRQNTSTGSLCVVGNNSALGLDAVVAGVRKGVLNSDVLKISGFYIRSDG